MSNLTVFCFESQEIRFVGTVEDPWWVASDICKVLQHSDTSKAVSRLDEDEKDTKIVRTPGGNQEMLCINQSGLYSLVITSRKQEAKRFKKWITSEVLPSIQKTGYYGIKPIVSNEKPDPRLIQSAIAAILGTAKLHENLIADAVGNAIARHYPELSPSVEEAKKFLPLPVENQLITVSELAKLYSDRFNTNINSPITLPKVFVYTYLAHSSLDTILQQLLDVSCY